MPDVSISPFDKKVAAQPASSAEGTRRPLRSARVRKFEPSSDPHSVWSAIWRGACNRCPACGGAALFASFLKPVEHCPVCGEDWTLHNADDLPPYIVILVIGHVVVSGMTSVEVAFHPAMWVQLAIWMPTIIALAVGLIQPAKGGVIALQWWHRMGGFEHRRSSIVMGAKPDAPSPFVSPLPIHRERIAEEARPIGVGLSSQCSTDRTYASPSPAARAFPAARKTGA